MKRLFPLLLTLLLFPAWFRPALLALLCAACGVLVFRLHCLERRLK